MFMKINIIFYYIKVSILLLISSFLLSCNTTRYEKQIVILAVNDMHANLNNFPKFAALVDSLRTVYPDMLLFSAGDNRTGNPYNDYYPEYKNLPMVNLMNELDFDLSCLGNHEFDDGHEGIRYFYEKTDFPVICANADLTAIEEIKNEPYIIIDNDDVRIGVVGLIETSNNGFPSAHPKNLNGIAFTDAVEKVKEFQFLESQCDLLVILSHCGYETDSVLATRLPETDLIIGGHTHYLIEKKFIDDVMITQAGNNLKYASLIKINLKNGNVVEKDASLIDVRKFSKYNEDIKELIDDYSDNEYFKTVVGIAVNPLENKDEMGCFMTDAVRYAAEADVAFQNPGGVRISNMPDGNISLASIYRLDPFANSVVYYEMTSLQIEEFIKLASVSDGGPLHVSGLSYTMNVKKNEKDDYDIISVSLFNDEAKSLDDSKLYRVAMNDYMAKTVEFAYENGPFDIGMTTIEADIDFLKNHKLDYKGTKRYNLNVVE